MNWESAFRVVAHELRSPAGVISGYSRLLKSGRLDADGETTALTQIDRASERLADLGEAASQLARWLEPRPTAGAQTVGVRALVEKAARATTATERVRVAHGPNVDEWHLRTDEPDALVAAIAAMINATIREVESPKGPVQVGVYNADRVGRCDIVMVADEFDGAVPPAMTPAPGFPLLESGGLGLQVVLGSAVLEAHGGEWWTNTEGRGRNGIRFPVESIAHD